MIEVNDLVKHFPKRGGFFNRVVAKVHAVNGVSFNAARGQTMGIVGESGCGKSTLARLIIGLLKPTSGSVTFDNVNISNQSYRQMMSIRRRMQMIFQDPQSSLNPRLTVASVLNEVVRFHKVVPAKERDAYIDQLIANVGLQSDDRTKYPHEFSGGQRQRIGIARALAVQPEFIIADEPVSALDVSVQAQVLNLLMELKEKFDLTLLFISHDLKVIEHFCDRILVMYLGYVVEELPCTDLAGQAAHPYTQGLLAANPIANPDQRHELTVLEGEIPSPYQPPQGCPFVTRCSLKESRCEKEMPPLIEKEPGHQVACWAVK